MVSMCSHISYAKGRTGGNLLLNHEIPFLHGGCLARRVVPARSKGDTRGQHSRTAGGNSLLARVNWNERKESSFLAKHNIAIIRWVLVKRKSQIVLKVKMRSKPRADSSPTISKDIPRQGDARTEQPLRVILRKRLADDRVGSQHTIRVKNKVRYLVVCLIPAIGELMPQANA